MAHVVVSLKVKVFGALKRQTGVFGVFNAVYGDQANIAKTLKNTRYKKAAAPAARYPTASLTFVWNHVQNSV